MNRRLIIFFAAFMVALCSVHGATSYRLSAANDTLFITGTGDMPNYMANQPWLSVANDIRVIIIEEGVTAIGVNAFSICDNLASVSISNTVSRIGASAFTNCRYLSSVTLGHSVGVIEDVAFMGCSSLTTLTIPNSATDIGDAAFADCDHLTTVVIGSSVTSIGDNAFAHCVALTSISILADMPPTIDTDTFDGVPSGVILIVPCASLTNYQGDPDWAGAGFSMTGLGYKNIQETICYGSIYTLYGFNLPAQTVSAIHELPLPSVGGCDTTLILHLTVRPKIDTTVTLAGITLTATQTGAAYQWFDCDSGNTDIHGAISRTFTPTANGHYAVRITLNDCDPVTSACTEVIGVGITETLAKAIAIYPNPVHDQLMIDNGELTIKTVQITDISGKVVLSASFPIVHSINVSSLTTGIYFIKITTNKGTKISKFVKD